MTSRPYHCSSCGKDRPRGDFHEAAAKDRTRDVYSKCKECRSDVYFSKRYSTICAQCLKHRLLNQNGVCTKCNEEAGLRECRSTCGNLLPSFLEFYGARKTCKSCSRQSRK